MREWEQQTSETSERKTDCLLLWFYHHRSRGRKKKSYLEEIKYSTAGRPCPTYMFTDPLHCVLCHAQTCRQKHFLCLLCYSPILTLITFHNVFHPNKQKKKLHWTIVFLLFLITGIPACLSLHPQCGHNTGGIVQHCYLQWGEWDNGERERETKREERYCCFPMFILWNRVLQKRNKNDGGPRGTTHNAEKGDMRVVGEDMEKTRSERSL